MTESDGNTPIKTGDAVRYVRREGGTSITVYTARAVGRHVITLRSPNGADLATSLNRVVKVCGEIVHRDWDSHVCGRRIKGQDLCGLHLSAKLRREAQEAERKRADAEHRSAKDQMQARLELWELEDTAKIHNVLKNTVLINLDDLIVLAESKQEEY